MFSNIEEICNNSLQSNYKQTCPLLVLFYTCLDLSCGYCFWTNRLHGCIIGKNNLTTEQYVPDCYALYLITTNNDACIFYFLESYHVSEANDTLNSSHSLNLHVKSSGVFLPISSFPTLNLWGYRFNLESTTNITVY